MFVWSLLSSFSFAICIVGGMLPVVTMSSFADSTFKHYENVTILLCFASPNQRDNYASSYFLLNILTKF